MVEGDIVKQVNSKPEQHFTPTTDTLKRPLIKTLKEMVLVVLQPMLQFIETIQKRYYVKLVAKRFEPTELNRQ